MAARSGRVMETGGLLLAQCAKDCGNDSLKMSLNQGRIGLFQVFMMATRCRQRLCQAAGKPSAPNGIGLRERHSILTLALHYPRHERVAEIADEAGIFYGRRSLFIRRCSLIRNRLIKMPRTNSWKWSDAILIALASFDRVTWMKTKILIRTCNLCATLKTAHERKVLRASLPLHAV